MLIALTIGVFVFDVPLKGSVLLLLVSSAVFLFGALGLGIMVSAMFRTQLMAYQMGTLISFLPAFLLSGFIYSIASMPRVIQVVSLFVPARYFMEVARGIFLKGIGVELLVVQSPAVGGLRRGGVLFRDAKAAAEGGVETMRQRLRRIIRKEFIQALRDPRMRSMLFLPPLIQLLIFGYAASLDVDTAKIAWMDQDRTPESRELLSEFQGSGRFVLAGMPENERAMQKMMDHGQVDAVVRVLPGFARDVKRGRATSVQVLLDGTNSNTASIVSGYASQTIARYSNEVLQTSAARENGRQHAGFGRRDSSRYAAGDLADPRLVQSRFAQPELLHSRGDREHHHAGDAVADRDGDRARKRNRHHGAVDGDSDPADGADHRQDAAVRAGGRLGHAAGDGRGAAGVPRPVPRKFLAAVCDHTAVPADDARRGTVYFHGFEDADSRR